MTQRVDIPAPKRYIIERCPYCGRRLAEWYEGSDVVTQLHGKAAVRVAAAIHVDEARVETHILEGSARCLRLTCRIRHRIRPKTPEVST